MIPPPLELRPWMPEDLVVLEQQNTPGMTRYLGGPEEPDAVRKRHERFLRGQAERTTWPFTVRSPDESAPVGSIVYWQSEHAGRAVYECGWAILPEHQGRGFATGAVLLGIDHATEHGDRDELWAFPRTDNGPSNALARAAGFRLRGEDDFEYPKGVPIRVNAWVVDLAAARAARSRDRAG